jgi:hypothetical protein
MNARAAIAAKAVDVRLVSTVQRLAFERVLAAQTPEDEAAARAQFEQARVVLFRLAGELFAMLRDHRAANRTDV